MEKIIIHTMDKDIEINKKKDLIKIAKRELANDIENNDSIKEIQKHNPTYPNKITSFTQAVDYLIKYFEDSYGDIAKLRNTKAYLKEKDKLIWKR